MKSIAGEPWESNFLSVATLLVMTAVFHFVVGESLFISFVFGSIAVATAPALNFALMGRFRIEGSLQQKPF